MLPFFFFSVFIIIAQEPLNNSARILSNCSQKPSCCWELFKKRCYEAANFYCVKLRNNSLESRKNPKETLQTIYAIKIKRWIVTVWNEEMGPSGATLPQLHVPARRKAVRWCRFLPQLGLHYLQHKRWARLRQNGSSRWGNIHR